MRGRGTGRAVRLCLLAACIGALTIQAAGADAIAAEAHAFDPALSLTGDCSTSPLDEVPDPGLCPIPPGVPGVNHPSAAFNQPGGIATDAYGDIYVSSTGPQGAGEGRIDVFDPEGFFITEIDDSEGPRAIAVDGEGTLYVNHVNWENPEYGVVRYEPVVYEPEVGRIEYGGWVGVTSNSEEFHGLAVDPATDHLFVKFPDHVAEYKSAAEGSPAEGNSVIEEFGYGLVNGRSSEGVGIAVDSNRERIYIGGNNVSGCVCIYVLDLDPPHDLLFTIKGDSVPLGRFVSATLSLAVDEETGHLFAADAAASSVYEFDQTGKYLTTIARSFEIPRGSELGLDDSEGSPNRGYLFVPSNGGGKGGGVGHSYAFGPSEVGLPEVVGSPFARSVGETEAELVASIEPSGLPTHYTFEYITRHQYQDQGESFDGAQTAGTGLIPAGKSPVDVAAAVNGLEPGTAYVFRVKAENEEGPDEAVGGFATYPTSEPLRPCPNDSVRTGFSATLPDCRAYELVTPPDTNARSPLGFGVPPGAYFAAPQASSTGERVSFRLEGGALPGAGASGSFAGDPYLAIRGEGGWMTSYQGPSGAEAKSVQPGSNSPDQGYSFWNAEGGGSALIEGKSTRYVRYPDGHSAPVGRGSINLDLAAEGKLISENGSHIIFQSANRAEHPAVQLEPSAPPDGTEAIYDRTPDEVTHVVSLLPGGLSPAAGEDAVYEGASTDGKGVAFKIGDTLYLRFENAATYRVGEEVTFAGVASGGSNVFYLEGGNLHRYDVNTGERTLFTTSGDVTVVNISSDSSTAYFVSPTAALGLKNPNGAEAVGGKDNLYRSKEGVLSFVGTVTEEDVAGKSSEAGLGVWVPDVASNGRAANETSRTTADGKTLIFESRAALDGYDPEGHVEIYRYDSTGNVLSCISCSPTLSSARGAGTLLSIGVEPGSVEALGPFALLANLSPDGRRAFFQSTEPLVAADNDGLQDVYEWEAAGVGSCGARPGGCIYLISSGHSTRPDYLYAVANEGKDVFFRSGDLLLPADFEETPSVYDARVEGGFEEEPDSPCRNGSCASGSFTSPSLPTPGMLPSQRSGNWQPSRRCPKGKRKVHRGAKVRCVKKHHKHHRRAGTKKKGGRK